MINHTTVPPGVDAADNDDAAMEVQTNSFRHKIIRRSRYSRFTVILNATKPYQTWYTQSKVAVGGIDRK